MSKYTDFFPLAATGGGSTEITNPDKIPLSYFGTTYGDVTPASMWWSISADNTAGYYSFSTIDPLIGTAATHSQAYRASASVSPNIEETLLNITDGSGYLCNVSTAVGKTPFQGITSSNQKIVIIVDGTTYTYEYDVTSSSQYQVYNNRLFWGYFANSFWYNQEYDPNNSTFLPPLRSNNFVNNVFGVGGQPTRTDDLLPPMYADSEDDQHTVANRRIFSANDFKIYNFPKLRFETSLVVKVTTENPDSTSDYRSYAGASYYLDTQVL